MPLFLVPLVGPFHLRFPRYNAVTVRDVAAALRPVHLLTSAVPAGTDDESAVLDSDEVALPLAVLPWTAATGRRLVAVGEPSPDPAAPADMERYLRQTSAGQEATARLREAREPVRDLLAQPLDQERVGSELAPALARLHRLRLELFGDGPGTDWLEARTDTVAERVRTFRNDAPQGVTVLLAPVEQASLLLGKLADARFAPDVPPTDDARRRALLDAALGGEAKDAEAMLRALRELAGAEARLAEADLLLTRGHVAEALETLEQASRGDFSRPYHVPGWLLARLGQLYDLAGRRSDALRAYRGVLALSWAPAAAREAAAEGLERPFDPGPGEG